MGSLFAALVLIALIAGGLRGHSPANEPENTTQCSPEGRKAPVSMPASCASPGRQCRDLTVPYGSEDGPVCPDED